MLSVALYLLIHFAICVWLFTFVQKPLFLWANRRADAEGRGLASYGPVLRHGYATDLIGAAFLTAPVLLLLWVYLLVPGGWITPALWAVEALTALIFAIVALADTALYGHWKSKLDRSVLNYLHSFEGATASVTPLQGAVAIGAVIALSACVLALFGLDIRIIDPAAHQPAGGWWKLLWSLCMVLMAGCLAAIIRGVKRHPNKPNMAYYSTNMFYNHAALCPLYSFVASLGEKEEFAGRYRYTATDAESAAAVDELIPTTGTPQRRLLRTPRPNIIVVMWESLGSYYVEPLGGKKGVTPRLNELARQGWLFTNVYSAGERTDRALLALFSGYPGQPDTLAIRHSDKVQHMPGLPRTLKERAGYHTAALHGGNLAVMNKKVYYLATGHDRIVERSDMPSSATACRWGVHDHVMFDRLLDEVTRADAAGRPWFITLQTLSSHEPYEVPFSRHDNKIANAFAYTDDAFGHFIDCFRQMPQWRDTLIIVVGDHGLNLTDEPLSHEWHARVPMLWLGGAVEGSGVIDTPVSQNDLAATLLGQLNLDHSHFRYSRDVLADTYTRPFAMHVYNNGFVVADPRGFTDFDNIAAQTVDGTPDAERERIGRSILHDFYTHLTRL